MTPNAVPPSEHFLQLFDSPESLVESVTAFVIGGLGRGENVLVVATPKHRELLAERLDLAGVNMHRAIAANRMVVADAERSLEKFMRHDVPNPIAFQEVVGTLVQRLANGKRLWIYGEMVDVLASRGHYKAAQQLEALWSGLGTRECFTLFCGYASGHFGNLRTASVLGAICAAHDHVRRNPEDILAEFLLDHPDVKAAATSAAGTPRSKP